MKTVLSWSELFPESDQTDDEPITHRRTTALEDEIRRLRKRVLTALVNGASGHYRVPRNILLIGQASSGKSSLVNLLKSALLGRYDQIAQPGSATDGRGSQFTNRLIPYYNMGFTISELEEIKQEFPDIVFPDDFVLPTIVDMPGLENRPHLVLDCILDGIVPENTELTIPLANVSLPAVDFSSRDQAIDHVVFVSSVAQDVSNNLFSDAYKVACRGERQIPYALIFTHIDQIEILSADQVKLRRDETRNLLWISRNSKLLSHDVINYSDNDPVSETDRTVYEVNLEKHKDALDAFLKIIKPKRRQTWTRMSQSRDVMRRYLDFTRYDNAGSYYRRCVGHVRYMMYNFACFLLTVYQTLQRTGAAAFEYVRPHRAHED